MKPEIFFRRNAVLVLYRESTKIEGRPAQEVCFAEIERDARRRAEGITRNLELGAAEIKDYSADGRVVGVIFPTTPVKTEPTLESVLETFGVRARDGSALPESK